MTGGTQTGDGRAAEVPAAPPAAAGPLKTYFARQPIFDWEQAVYAYELLYRSSTQNAFDAEDAESATERLIVDHLLVTGARTLTGGKPFFLNATRQALLEEHFLLLPPESTVVEILETVTPDEEIVAACRNLRDAGYLVAIDDYTGDGAWDRLIELADFVKVDFSLTGPETRRAIVARHRRRDLAFLAEKVETIDVFEQALEYGYDYFQGYFFCRPTVVEEAGVTSPRHTLLQLLEEVNRPRIDFDRIESRFRIDVAFSFRLLKYINSAFFGLRSKVSSIRHALSLLGENEIRKWVTLLALARLSEDRPAELFTLAVVRARFCEQLAIRVGAVRRSDQCFLAGMFTVIDAMLGTTREQALRDVPLDDEIRGALSGEPNFAGRVLQCGLAWEEGRWGDLERLAAELGVAATALAEVYIEAVAWADRLVGMGGDE